MHLAKEKSLSCKCFDNYKIVMFVIICTNNILLEGSFLNLQIHIFKENLIRSCHQTTLKIPFRVKYFTKTIVFSK